ncbi:MAG: TetR/AcrR family transcriptional regulator [Syntrophorhabdaceae bacterium]
MSPRANSYDVIIDAAEAVVIEAGATHMTLDAVAAKAGVSKGGLLHHFPNKIALLVAMIERQIKKHNEARDKILATLPEGPSRELKSFVLAVQHRDRLHYNLGASMSAAIAHDPHLNEPVRKVIKDIYRKFTSSGLPFEKASIIALAADGLRYQEMLNLSPFTDKQRIRILDELVRLVDEAGNK